MNNILNKLYRENVKAKAFIEPFNYWIWLRFSFLSNKPQIANVVKFELGK